MTGVILVQKIIFILVFI